MSLIRKSGIVFFILCLFVTTKIFAQERPFIWVQKSEKEAILQKIEQRDWAKSLYQKFLERVEPDLSLHQEDVAAFLSQLPFDRQKQVAGTTPPFKLIIRGEPDSGENTDKIMHYLQTGIDCGMFYFLTGEEKYAQCALDILNVALFGIGQLPFPVEAGNHGWVFPEDHLFEARVFGAQVPIIYDFVAPFIKKGGRPFDLGKNKKIDFPAAFAQKVFFSYAKLAIEQGMTGTNWSVLEAPSFVQNLLALNNKAQRDSLLEIYLTVGSPRQDPLSEIASHYNKLGDVYPETSQYSSAVSSLSTTIITIVEKYNTSLQLAEKYPYLPLALSRWEVLKYPNEEIVRFGDGKRHGGTSYQSCEIAYYLGKTIGSRTLTDTFGDLLQTAISKNEYTRGELGRRSFGASAYFEPLQLLWACPTIEGNVENRKVPRTDEMPHASVFLQRNLSKTGKAEDGLMCFVGGAHMVHGHANGMNIELYGKGQVLGVDHGNGAYRKDIHENYSRLFAAHNTIIVNGNSQSDSGWANLGINPVQLITMEPMPREEAVSPYYSFSITSFKDDKGDKAEAYQERTLALVRTSATAGYYVDVFRSKSELPNQYHDYLYHNIGDNLEFLNDDLILKSTPERYMANVNLPWLQNRQYRHPGWHFFEEVQTSQPYSKDVKLRFVANKFEKPIYMNLYIPGFENREYTKVEAPKTFEAPAPYENKSTPTLVVRKTGEAWTQPFAVVYEPSDGNANSNSVQKVEKLLEDGVFKGLKIEIMLAGKKLRQYVLTPTNGQEFKCKNPEIVFKGTFAIITVNDKDKLQNIYIGDGEELRFGDSFLKPDNQKKSVYREYSNED